MLDIFNTNEAFQLTQLTDAFIKTAYVPGRIGALGLFRSSGIPVTTVAIEWKSDSIELIQTSPRGGGVDPAPMSGSLAKRSLQAFAVPHLEKTATVYADSVQNVRAFGSQDGAQAVQAVVNEKLALLRQAHEVTLEHMRIGAVQGTVKDADGSTLVNLFTAFNVSQSTGYVTPNDITDEKGKLRDEVNTLMRTVEGVLGNQVPTGYMALCGSTFYDAMRKDVSIQEVLKFADAQSLLQNPTNGVRSFQFAGVQWEEYRGSYGGTPFVAAGEAYLVPMGVDIFRTYFAPADYIEAVNTLGLPGYAKIIPDPDLNRYVKIHTQSNPLVICLRPDAVVKVDLTS